MKHKPIMDEIDRMLARYYGFTDEELDFNTIRITATQWVHVTEAHDYMSGNMDKILETLAEPERVIAGQHGESLALRAYARYQQHQKVLER